MTRSRDQLLRINSQKYILSNNIDTNTAKIHGFLLFSVFGKVLEISYHMAGKFDSLTFFALTVKLISVNVNFIFLILCAFLLCISSN